MIKARIAALYSVPGFAPRDLKSTMLGGAARLAAAIASA
jgi:hypothetical protein